VKEARVAELGKRLLSVLPPDTAKSWEMLRDLLPASMTLYGGTAIAAHLHHRVSRDLDFFFDDNDVRLERLAEHLGRLRKTAITFLDDDSLNAVFGDTKVQFLRTRGQVELEPPTNVEGLLVAGIRDLLATKLKVIADRGEMRDYYDIMLIEQQTPFGVEAGLLDYQARYNDRNANNLFAIVRALGYLDDVVDDPGLPVSRTSIEAYWQNRQIDVLAALDSSGSVRARPGRLDIAALFAPEPREGGPEESAGRVWVAPHVRNGRRVEGHWRRT